MRIPSPTAWHSIPDDEIDLHHASESCWCSPSLHASPSGIDVVHRSISDPSVNPHCEPMPQSWLDALARPLDD